MKCRQFAIHCVNQAALKKIVATNCFALAFRESTLMGALLYGACRKHPQHQIKQGTRYIVPVIKIKS